jgi:hypothetical protein
MKKYGVPLGVVLIALVIVGFVAGLVRYLKTTKSESIISEGYKLLKGTKKQTFKDRYTIKGADVDFTFFLDMGFPLLALHHSEAFQRFLDGTDFDLQLDPQGTSELPSTVTIYISDTYTPTRYISFGQKRLPMSAYDYTIQDNNLKVFIYIHQNRLSETFTNDQNNRVYKPSQEVIINKEILFSF